MAQKIQLPQIQDKNLISEADQLYYWTNPKGRKFIWIPQEHFLEALTRAHHAFHHLSWKQTYQSLRKLFHFPKMRKFIREMLQKCATCLRCKTKRNHFLNPATTYETYDGPFQTLHLDHFHLDHFHLGPNILFPQKFIFVNKFILDLSVLCFYNLNQRHIRSCFVSFSCIYAAAATFNRQMFFQPKFRRQTIIYLEMIIIGQTISAATIAQPRGRAILEGTAQWVRYAGANRYFKKVHET